MAKSKISLTFKITWLWKNYNLIIFIILFLFEIKNYIKIQFNSYFFFLSNLFEMKIFFSNLQYQMGDYEYMI